MLHNERTRSHRAKSRCPSRRDKAEGCLDFARHERAMGYTKHGRETRCNMDDNMTAAVPTIPMSLPADRFAKDFGAWFERFGFAMITDHGIDPALIEEAWTKAKTS